MKLLVVDDNPINQKFLFYSLRKYYDIETANNGLEAVNMLEKDLFDVVLMDLSMPVMDGAEATLQVRCMGNGADDYLIKPIDIEKLLSTIDYHLKQKEETSI